MSLISFLYLEVITVRSFKANDVAGAQTGLQFELGLSSTYSKGVGDLSSLILVVKCLTCLR